MKLLEKIDALQKMLKTDESKKLLSEIRREVKDQQKRLGAYSTYLADTLDGLEPESAYDYFQKKLKL